MRFTVHDDADAALGHFSTYGEATADARMRSLQADSADAVFSVRDHEYGLTLNAFRRGETLKERVHKNAYLAVTVALNADQLRRLVAEYADELGVPELATISYDEAVDRCTDGPAFSEVFQAAAERLDTLQAR